MRVVFAVALVAGCAPADSGRSATGALVFPAPDAWISATGPGVSHVAFPEEELLQPCAYLTGGEGDSEHYNLSVVHDGYLWFPWAPEDGGGGISVFDLSDPCAPQLIGEGWDDRMRESHSLAFSEVDGREYLAVDYHEVTADGRVLGGVGFWDVTDRAAPAWVSELALPGYYYPDSYTRVTLSTFWVGPTLYVAGAGLGVFVVDATDPLAPALVTTVKLDTPHLVGTFHVVGTTAMSSSAGLSRTVLMDVSDPWAPAPLPGGDFNVVDDDGTWREYYFSNVGGRYGLFARKDHGGGPIIYDISDPAAPERVSQALSPEGDGGYVFRHEDRLFVGESGFGAIYDFSDPSHPVELARLYISGDVDTVTPVGNALIASVDSGADPGQGAAIMPWRAEPDGRGPVVEWHQPAAGATFVPTTARIGLSFDELVESASVFEGSFRVWDADGVPVEGRFNTQESLVNFTPLEPLADDVTYLVEVPAGGIVDVSGNPTSAGLVFRFSTGGEVTP
ncbi:MAG: hypothetical protein ACI8PZ_006463 [Myxococcota bacterium]|jgi:hypothetical protein